MRLDVLLDIAQHKHQNQSSYVRIVGIYLMVNPSKRTWYDFVKKMTMKIIIFIVKLKKRKTKVKIPVISRQMTNFSNN